MARLSFKYNVFKNEGYKNRERNSTAYIRFMEYPDGTPFRGTFEEYMDLVEKNPKLFNFPPLVIETTGFLACSNLGKICKSLAIRKCRDLNGFLDGNAVSLKKNVFSIQSYASLFPDKASAQRCFSRMMANHSPFICVNPLFDGVYPQTVCIHEDSVKVLGFTKEPRDHNDKVHFQVRFDMDVSLKKTVPPMEKSCLKSPICWEHHKQFYSLARTLNDHLDHFYFVEYLDAVMLKNESDEESDRTFCMEFQNQMENCLVGDYIRTLHPFLGSSEWRDKLMFWINPEKFDFKKPPYQYIYSGFYNFIYEVPHPTCSNNLRLHVNWHMDSRLINYLKTAYEQIEKKTMEMIFSRMPYTIQVGEFYFVAQIRDVRTIQKMEEHCLHVFNAMKNFYDYIQQEMISRGEDFLQHISRVVLEQIKLDPLEYAESDNPHIKKLATALVNGSYYGE